MTKITLIKKGVNKNHFQILLSGNSGFKYPEIPDLNIRNKFLNSENIYP